MDYQKLIISTVESFFPTGTKRRELINIVGKPVARALGFHILNAEAGLNSSNKKLYSLIHASEGNKNYWEYIRNFLRLKTELFLSDPASELAFPECERPEVSILIITFNKAEYTYQCLETIKANTDTAYEIIIVDNASSDQTHALLEKLRNVLVIKNGENAGFLKACNQAARHARGEYILFLNNDTQVTPGWLDTLVETVKTYPGCGAVGGKLIFPNGKLQEAGSITWKDGSTLGYGRNSNPFSPEYCYVKEVDYCSGACLLVRKGLFIELGGFDERYAPAYYEEADLCMAIKSSGHKIVFQPDSRVIHYEFGSGSFNDASRLVLDNRDKFVAKWKDALEGQHILTEESILCARDGRKTPKILIVDDRIPAPYLGSGYPRTYELLCYLAELGYTVTYFPLQDPSPLQPHTKYLQQRGIEALYGEGKIDISKFLESRNDYYDLVFVSRPHNIASAIGAIKKHTPSSRVIYDAEAIFALREILQLKVKGEELREEKQKELVAKEIKYFKEADILVAVSDYEKKIFADYGFNNVEVWGHPVRPAPTVTDFGRRKDILFVGTFLAPGVPNEDAVLHFVRDIFPKIKEELDCKLWVVGTNSLESIRGLESSSVKVTGRVDDLREYFERCRLFIVPHRFAAGIPLKLLEAMGYGLPVVVSPLMAKQLGLTHGKEVLVGETPEDFAAQVVSLYSDEGLWTDRREASLKYVSEKCDPEKMKKNIDEIIKRLLATRVRRDKPSFNA